MDDRVRALVKALGLAATSDAATRTAIATLMNAATQVGQRLGTGAVSFADRILPAPGTGNANKIAKINSSNQWALADEATGLPDVTTADNDDVLTVVNGVWTNADAPAGGLSPHVTRLPGAATKAIRATLLTITRHVTPNLDY